MAINAAVESEKKVIAIKAIVQPASGNHNPRKFIGMLGGNPSIQMAGLGSIFQAPDNNYMVAEALE